MNSPSKSVAIAINNLDHLGLVAGLIDDIGVVEILDEIVGRQKTELVSVGEAVKSMILNGLGLVSAPLYLFSRFFEGKATAHLLGEGIQPEHLNDDRLGRVLDILWEKGLSNIFMSVALTLVKKYDISVETLHLDRSSFHVHGEYNNRHSSEDENEEPRCIEITYGYSRDHRPDLKQFTLDLMCSGDGDIPLWMRTGSGNSSDTQEFGRILQQFKKEMDWESLFVSDSAFYSQENLLLTVNLKWLTRVPLTLKAAQKLIAQVSSEELIPSETASESNEKLAPLKRAAGRFIIATNVLDSAVLSDEEMLSHYKGQQAVERGFRFLKDPMFLTDSVFLKSPQRIEALSLIMGLCLLVYSLGQRQLRSKLQRREATVPNQLGRPTQRPTLLTIGS